MSIIETRSPRFEKLLPFEPKSVEPNVGVIKQELKPLPNDLKYVFSGKDETHQVIISSKLSKVQEKKLTKVIKNHQSAISWTIADIKGISPLICTHCIYLEEDFKPSRHPQRRLNPHLKEIVRTEVLKLLDADIIYSISASK